MELPPALHTQRLTLSVPTERDIDAVFAIHSDVRTYQHRPGLAMKSRAEAIELVQAWQQNWNDNGLGYYVVSTREGTTIGFAGLRHSQEAGEEVLNLYYRFAPEAQGRGYAREAATAALDDAHERFSDLPIVAIVDPTNEASIALAIRLGLHHVPGAGVAGDYEVYQLNLQNSNN
ncbi:GNAT family N-acetyltransferase [uncultured Corynebacterium sp.]|uniref:GNAT family N-acetyltransferase n=1 Tax=uncultured Corynebacterium sp. TaxID=159447 RepID=UPI0025CD0F42|nr:GNAT family N-acetyltransferase [uncultured Corynebacterium sp.]